MEKLRCLKCGTLAACSCGVPYVSKLEYAMAHMKLNKTDRVNAKGLGVSKNTTARARKQLAQKGPTEPESAKRKGKDGKMYAGRKRGRPKMTAYEKLEAQGKREWEKRLVPPERWEVGLTEDLARILRWEKDWTEKYGEWRQFSMTPCTYQLLSRAAAVLNEMLNQLIKQQPEETTNVVRH